MNMDKNKNSINKRTLALFFQWIFLIIGFALSLLSLLTLTHFITKLAFLLNTLLYVILIYYVSIDYKNGERLYKMAIYLSIATLLIGIPAISIYVNPILGLLWIIEAIILILFIKNFDTTNVASKLINSAVIMYIIICVLWYVITPYHEIGGYSYIFSIFAYCTFALIYYLLNEK